MSSSGNITPAQKARYFQALRANQYTKLGDLIRVEKDLAKLGTPDCSEPMTTAWKYYVNQNFLLTELRGLTKNYPFSPECIDEAKQLVHADPESNRTWNFCWLVLNKIKTAQLLPRYADWQASQPAMWGVQTPTAEQINQLSTAMFNEWYWAVDQILGRWPQPPTR